MRKTITLSTFRRMHAAEEQMMRATMPRISASDPEPTRPAFAAAPVVLASRNGSRLVRPLTATIEEVLSA